MLSCSWTDFKVFFDKKTFVEKKERSASVWQIGKKPWGETVGMKRLVVVTLVQGDVCGAGAQNR